VLLDADKGLEGILFKPQIVFIKFVGAHRDYDKIDAQTVEWESKP
jgi:hypothetical protein